MADPGHTLRLGGSDGGSAAGGRSVLLPAQGTPARTGTIPAPTSISHGHTRFNFNTGALPANTPTYFLRLLAEDLP